ncbi:hypothetical protein SK128_022601, partial [Halocaridina rubra]
PFIIKFVTPFHVVDFGQRQPKQCPKTKYQPNHVVNNKGKKIDNCFLKTGTRTCERCWYPLTRRRGEDYTEITPCAKQ